MSRKLMTEFERWRTAVDVEGLLDTFDLALGFYAGRHPGRAHSLACDFASKARERYPFKDGGK